LATSRAAAFEDEKMVTTSPAYYRAGLLIAIQSSKVILAELMDLEGNEVPLQEPTAN
jgi:hypothetical protein